MSPVEPGGRTIGQRPRRELPGHEVHFWFTRMTETDPRLTELGHLLSAAEIERAARFHFEKDRCSYIISHGVLRQLLFMYLDLSSTGDITYETNTYGKPSLPPSCGDGTLQFNMSHTAGMAVYALTRNRLVGIDVERVDRALPDHDEIAAGFFSPEEAAVYRSLPTEQSAEGFYNCWTRKESFIKAKGKGLSCPLDSFQVTLRPGEPARLLTVQDGTAARWSLASLDLLGCYKAAITAEAPWQLVDCGEVA